MLVWVHKWLPMGLHGPTLDPQNGQKVEKCIKSGLDLILLLKFRLFKLQIALNRSITS